MRLLEETRLRVKAIDSDRNMLHVAAHSRWLATNPARRVLNSLFAWATNPNWISAASAASADGAGFAAFGKVIAGLDVVQKIHQSPAKEQALEPSIAITRVKLVRD